MMSTADSQLLVSTSAITEDFIHQYLQKDFSDKLLVLISRYMIILLGVIATVLQFIQSLWEEIFLML